MRALAAVLLAVVAVALLATPSRAAPVGVVEGTVTDRTTGRPAANAPVALQVASGGAVETTTDSEGRFRVVGVETAETYQPIVQYAGANFFLTPITFAPGSTLASVAFDVYQVTRDPADIRVESGSFLLGDLDRDRQVIQLLQVLSIRNDGQTAYIGTEGPNGQSEVLRLRWPAATLDVEPLSAVAGQLSRTGDGFALSAPIPPGVTQVVIGYDVAYTDERKVLELDFGFPFDQAFMLVPEHTFGVESRDVTFDQVVEVEGLRVARYRGGPSERSNISLTLTGLPLADPGLSPDSTAGRSIAIGAAAVAVLLVGAYTVRYPRRRPATSGQAALARDALFNERIARDNGTATPDA